MTFKTIGMPQWLTSSCTISENVAPFEMPEQPNVFKEESVEVAPAAVIPSEKELAEMKPRDRHVYRLVTRVSAKYFNMNPFEVLQVDYDAELPEVNKAYRKLSLYVHPDKAPNDADAAVAFDVISKAFKMLQDEEELQYAKKVVDEAKHRVAEQNLARLKSAKLSSTPAILEGDALKAAINTEVCKLFAEVEIRKTELEMKEQQQKEELQRAEQRHQRKRKEREAHEAKWEEGRGERVDAWRKFELKKMPRISPKKSIT